MYNSQVPKKSITQAPITINVFNDINALASGATNAIVTYTVPSGKTFALELVEFSGENIANYRIYIDSTKVAERRTWFGGDLSGEFIFRGYRVQQDKVITLEVNNFRSTTGDFEGRIVGGFI